jgi:hypothetical protein
MHASEAQRPLTPLPPPPFESASIVNSAGTVVVRARVLAGEVLLREVPVACFDFEGTSRPFAEHARAANAEGALPHLIAFGGEDGASAMTAALLPLIARLGHSSTPTATLSVPLAYRVSPRVVVSVVALVDLQPGDAVTLCLASRLGGPEEHARRLEWRFGPGKYESGLPPTVPLPSPLAALHAAVPGSALVSAKTAPDAFAAATSFLSAAVEACPPSHPALFAARRTAIVALMHQQKWAEAWAVLRVQAIAVFLLLPHPADAEAQYHAHGLAEHILRGWQVTDAKAAGDASLGAMLRYTAHSKRTGGGGTDHGPDAWVRDMMAGAQVLRPAQAQGFVDAAPA